MKRSQDIPGWCDFQKKCSRALCILYIYRPLTKVTRVTFYRHKIAITAILCLIHTM